MGRMKPTVGEIATMIDRMIWLGNSPEKIAEEIHSRYNPVMKPLTELANSEEDCRKVFEHVFPGRRFERVVKYSSGIDIEGDNSCCMVTENTLRNADFIRSLGYDLTPET